VFFSSRGRHTRSLCRWSSDVCSSNLSADTLNAAGRLLYVPLIGLSLFGNTDRLGTTAEPVSRRAPGGCLETLLSAAMGATAWSDQSWGALFASVGYTVVFAVIGIRWFRWVSH